MDPTSILEAWMGGAANLPAEIRHLFDELKAKDIELNSVTNSVEERDQFIQTNSGTHADHPKEKEFTDEIRKGYARMLEIQDRKVALVEKALKLLESHNNQLITMMDELPMKGLLPEEATPISAHPTISTLRQKKAYSRNGSISQSSATQDCKSIAEDGTVPTVQLPKKKKRKNQKKRKTPSSTAAPVLPEKHPQTPSSTAAPVAPMSQPSATETPEPKEKRSTRVSIRGKPVKTPPSTAAPVLSEKEPKTSSSTAAPVAPHSQPSATETPEPNRRRSSRISGRAKPVAGRGTSVELD